MAEQRAIYGEEKGRLQTDVRTLDEKIKTRETRLVELLIPIDGMKERAEKVLSKAQETAKSLVEREEEVEELKEALTEKIDDLTEPGEAGRAVRLYELFLSGCYEKADEIDDSSGNLGMFFQDLFLSWIKARQKAGHAAEETVGEILNWMENDEYGFLL